MPFLLMFILVFWYSVKLFYRAVFCLPFLLNFISSSLLLRDMSNLKYHQAVEPDDDRLKLFFKRMAFHANVVDNRLSADYWQNSGILFFEELSTRLFDDRNDTAPLNEALAYIGSYLKLDDILVYLNDGSDVFKITCGVGNDDVLVDTMLGQIPWDSLVSSGRWFYQKDDSFCANALLLSFDSAWLFPLRWNRSIQGVDVYGSRHKSRSWYGIEVEQLHLATALIARYLEFQEFGKQNKFNTLLGQMMFCISKVFDNHDSLDHQIKTILAESSQLVGATRGYIFELVGTNKILNSYEWLCSLSTTHLNPHHELVFDDDFPGWRKWLETGHSISSSSPPLDGSLPASLFDHNNGISYLVFPLSSQGVLLGFAGFDFDISECVDHSGSVFSSLEVLSKIIEGLLELKCASEQINALNSDLKRFNERLLISEQLVKGIVSAAPLGIFMLQGGQIVYANDCMISMASKAGWPLVGASMNNSYPFCMPNCRTEVDQFIAEIRAVGSASMRLDVCRQDGGRQLLDLKGAKGPVVDGDVGCVVVCQDVTDSVVAHNRIEEANMRYQTILDKNPDGVLIFSSHLHLCYINPSGIELLGSSCVELQKISIRNFFSKKEDWQRICRLLLLVAQGKDFQGELKLDREGCDPLLVEAKATLILLDGLPHYYLCIHNITKRKQWEEQLRVSEYKYRALIENSPDCMVRMDLDGGILFVNQATKSIFGHSGDDAVVAFSDDVRQSFLKSLRDVMLTRCVGRFEMEFVFEGQPVFIEWSVIPEFTNTSTVESVLFIGRDCSTRQHTEAALKKAIEKTEIADKLKSAFLNNLSHEIRTPLNAVVGFSSFLREDNLCIDDRNLYVDIIHNNAEALMALIDDIVDVAKLESGSLMLKDEFINLNDLFLKLERQFALKIKAEKKNLDLVCQINQTKPAIVQGDSHRLFQALSKLLDNSVKFTSEGFVQFGYEWRDSGIEIFVSDSGIGIAVEDHSIVFDSFRQGDQNSTKKFGGTGVGLYIARKLVEAMGAGISFQSKPQKGSVFYINFPPNRSSHPKETLCGGRTSFVPIDVASLKDKLILLAIDDSSERLMIRRYLEDTGASIISVRSIYSALQLIQNRSDIDWLVVDHAASSNGALRLIESHYKSSNGAGKLILISADSGLTERDVQVDLLLQKPFDKHTLVESLAGLV